jgi:hypothetical protein
VLGKSQLTDILGFSAFWLFYIHRKGDGIMTSAHRIGFVLAAFVMLAGASSAAQVPIQGLQLFNSVALPKTSTNRGDEVLAIDDDTNSFSYLTPSYSTGQRFTGLDFGSSVTVNRLQVNKASSNIDGYLGAADPIDLQLLYTTDSGPIADRNYQPVSGLTNGYLGTELITATSVNAGNATVISETQQGIYSLSFNSISATGLALAYSRNPAGDAPFIHYPTSEFKPMNGTTLQTVAAIDTFRQAIPVGGLSANRWSFVTHGFDHVVAVDGDANTWSYLTMSFTNNPVTAALDLGSATSVNRIRVNKVTNQVTGSGIVEPMNVQILYTTDSGPLNQRTYQPVTGLTNGFNGSELVNAPTVDSPTASVLGEIHEFAADGWFSLSFNAVNATAIAYVIAKPDGSANQYINYPIAEFELYAPGVVAHPGDFDGDGDVDGADFVAWQTNFPKASGATLAQGDADGDGDVDGADFVVWQTNFPFAPGPGVSSIPEPVSILPLALGVIFVFRHRTRSRRYVSRPNT